MHAVESGRRPFGECDGPGDVGGAPVVIPDEKASDAADRLANSGRGCGTVCQLLHVDSDPLRSDGSGESAPDQATVPGDATAGEEERKKGAAVE